jgi:hypothetical protein
LLPLIALFRLAFASPPPVTGLSSPQQLTRWLILQKARCQGSCPLQPVVSTRFQSLFHSPRRGSFHLSLTVLFRYRSSSVFSLGRWTSQLPTPLACGVVLRILPIVLVCVYGTLTLYGRLSHTVPLRLTQLDGSPTTPVDTSTGLGFSAFARHYSQNTLFSSGYLDVSVHPVPSARAVHEGHSCGFPHSDISGCYGCTRLTGAFRSVPRPSSALDTKASPVCPYSLLTRLRPVIWRC